MYGKWLYKEIGTEYGACMVEIYHKNYTGESIEIGALAADSLSIALENLGSITDPIGKSVCSFSIIDTNQVEYDDFFTPDATALKVVVSTRVGRGAYVTRWSGYITPDFFAENLSYRTPISISARDNIGYLNDVDFDLTATSITVRELIQSAFRKIAEDYPMSLSFVTKKQTAEGVLAIDAIVSTALFSEMTWTEVLETILHDLGLQMRWVDNNTIAVLDLSQIPEYYTTQSFNFVDASGYREIVPAWRQLGQEQDYGVRENFFEGWLREDNMTFVKEEVVTDNLGKESRIKLYAPNNWQVSGNTYTINLANYKSINRFDGFPLAFLTRTYREIPFKGFENRVFFTGTKKENTDYSSYMGYRMPIYSGQSPLEITFKALNTYLIPQDGSLHIYNPEDDIIFADSSIPRVQLGIKMNILLHSGVNTYILKEKWEQLTSAETDSITFVLDKIGGVEPYYHTTDYDKEQELSINIHSIPFDGELELRIYGYFIESAEDAVSSDYEEFASRYVTYINDVTYAYVNKDVTGQSALVGVNDTHNIKQAESYKIGQVVDNRGNINAFAGGLYYPANTPNPLYPMRGFQRNADATNYNLLELVGREIIHFNKRNYNRLSGTIRNLDKEPLMFNRLFVREGKKYAPYNYSLNVISNEMNITSMQEVEPYTTASFTEINSEISTGGSTVSSGNNQILQYSAEVGNAKRLYELQTISENEKPDAYVLVDGAGYPEARKLKLTDIAGLDKEALEQYLVQYKYLQEADLAPIIQDFEKLDEAVSPLFGYFDASGSANNALKLGGQLPSYYASQSSLDTTNANVTSLTQKLSTIESGVATNKTNIATLTTNLSDLTGRVDIAEDALKTYGDSIAKNAAGIAANAKAIGVNETAILQLGERVDKLEGYWYIDDDGNLHTTYSIVVEGGGAFGKGSGGGGDVPSGGGIDEAQLWNILGTSGTQTIHSSHIPDLSGKYLSVNGGTIDSKENTALIINTTGYHSVIKFNNAYGNSATIGYNNNYGAAIINGSNYLSVKNDGTPNYNGNTLIHSGNIGSQSVDYANSAGMLARGTFSDANAVTYTDGGLRWFSQITSTASNIPTYTGYQNGLLALPLHPNGITAQWYFSYSKKPYYRSSQTLDWNEIAYVTDNVASATKLQTVRTIWGQSFDGSADVSGNLTLANEKRILTKDVNGNAYAALYLSNLNTLLLGFETSIYGYTTKVQGNEVWLNYGTTHNIGLILNSVGNILIGTTTDNGYKLDVNGTLNATTIYQNGTAIGSLAFKSSLVASDIPNLSWSKITSGKPTTLGGYGITDALRSIRTTDVDVTNTTTGLYGYWGAMSTLHGINSNYYHILNLDWNNDLNNWISQLAIPTGYSSLTKNASIHYRNRHSSTWSDWVKVLDSNNYSSYALPLSGGILNSGSDQVPLVLNSTGATIRVAFKKNNTTLGYLGFAEVNKPLFINSNGDRLSLIHSGNIGSQNVANADTLDGYHADVMVKSYKDSADNLTRFTERAFFQTAWISGQGDFGSLVIPTWTGNSAESYYTTEIRFYNALTNPKIRVTGPSGTSDWYTLARTVDNVASATKLQTARTIWGHSFDGTGNITKTLHITEPVPNTEYTEGIRINTMNGEYSSVWFNTTNISGYDKGMWGITAMASGNFRIRGGVNGLSDFVNITKGGNVLVGTTTDSGSKLQVQGYGTMSDGLTLGYRFSSPGSSNAIGAWLKLATTGHTGSNAWVIAVDDTSSASSFLKIGYDINSLSFSFEHSGNLVVSGGGAFGSDIRYKDITSYRQLDLETIVNAPLFTFKWTDREDKEQHLGTSAQYWLGTQAKDAVNITNPKFYHLDYGALAVGIGISVAREVKGVKTEVQILREKVNQLEKELAQYRRA